MPTAPTAINPHSWEMAKTTVLGVIGTVIAAGEMLEAQPGVDKAVSAKAVEIVPMLTGLQDQIASSDSPADWRAAALSAVKIIQGVYPMIMPFLGPAGPYVPVALLTVQMLIMLLPLPSAPPAPAA